jgi:hypothetical protein
MASACVTRRTSRRFDSRRFDGCRRSERHEAMWRAMEDRESGGNDERRDVAPIPRSMRAQLSSGAGTVAPAPPQTGSLFPWRQPATPAPASAPSTAASNQSVMKQCGAQWQSAKANGATNGETWPQFLKECRGRLASATSAPPSGGFAPVAPVPAPAPANYGNAAPTGTGQFASEQEARYHCPSDTVVWANERSHIYHFPGTSDYGHMKRGAFSARRTLRPQEIVRR